MDRLMCDNPASSTCPAELVSDVAVLDPAGQTILREAAMGIREGQINEDTCTFSDLREAVEEILTRPGDHLEMLVMEIQTRLGRDLTMMEHSLICAANWLGVCERRSV